MAMKQRVTKKLGRIRPPRVHITYDVETGGAVEKRELPFVVGVLADLAIPLTNSDRPLSDRPFLEIDRDNFDAVMAGLTPQIQLEVRDYLTVEGSTLSLALKITSMGGFDPAEIAKQVEPLGILLNLRQTLAT